MNLPIAGLLITHFFADFVLQSDRMAQNKSSSWQWLSIHVLAYTGALALFAVLFVEPEAIWLFLGVNAAAHYATDAVTSRITKRLWDLGRVHDFFIVIGFDQLLHTLTLLTTFTLLGGTNGS